MKLLPMNCRGLLRNGMKVRFAKYPKSELGEFRYLGIIPGPFDAGGEIVNGQIASWKDTGNFADNDVHDFDIIKELAA